MYEMQITEYFDAPIGKVFDAITDHENFFGGAPLFCEVAVAGEKDRNGIGAVRKITVLGFVFSEEVTEFERPSRVAYIVRNVVSPTGWGHQAKSERGSMTFTKSGNRTKVVWKTQLAMPFPLPFVGPSIEKLTSESLGQFCRYLLRRTKLYLEQGIRDQAIQKESTQALSR